MTVKWGRRESAQNSPTSPLRLGRDTADVPALSAQTARSSSCGCGFWAQVNPGSPGQFAYMPRGCRLCQTALFTQSVSMATEKPTGTACLKPLEKSFTPTQCFRWWRLLFPQEQWAQAQSWSLAEKPSRKHEAKIHKYFGQTNLQYCPAVFQEAPVFSTSIK